MPKPLFFRAAAEYLLFTWLQLGVETDGTHRNWIRDGWSAAAACNDKRYAALCANVTRSLWRTDARIFASRDAAAEQAELVTQRVRSVDLLHTRPCEPLVAAGLGRLRRLSHVFLLEDARTLREIRRLSTLDATRAVPHQLVQPRARLMHAEQRPCTMAQKIAGGGCAVATNLEHTCSLELYTQVATTIGARSNFTLR